MQSALKVLLAEKLKKTGKSMCTNDMVSYKPIVIGKALLLHKVELYKSANPDTFNVVLNLVKLYVNDMIDNALEKKVDEVKYVQPRSFKLLEEIIEATIPVEAKQFLVIANKELDASKIAYSTTIVNLQNQAVYVSGETDASVYYREVCVFNWEDKSLDKECKSPAENGQVWVEVKGFAEAFKLATMVEPKRFDGVLTSGRNIVFINRLFHDGSVAWAKYDNLQLFNIDISGRVEIDNTNVEIMAGNLCLAMENTIKLISQIDERAVAIYNDLDDLEQEPELDDGYDKEEGEEEAISEVNSKMKGLRVHSSKGVATNTSSNKENSQCDGKTRVKRSSTSTISRALLTLNIANLNNVGRITAV